MTKIDVVTTRIQCRVNEFLNNQYDSWKPYAISGNIDESEPCVLNITFNYKAAIIKMIKCFVQPALNYSQESFQTV